MRKPWAEFKSEEEQSNLIRHCEQVIKEIKKERKVMRSRLQTLRWRQKRYERMIEDARERPMFIDPEL